MGLGPILVTGFEPFGGELVNPSQLVVESLPVAVAGRELRTAVLPVDPVKGFAAAVEAIDSHRPAAVVSLGQSGFPLVQLERVFVNLFHTDGREEPVVPSGPDGVFATLDHRAMLLAAAAAGQPVCSSLSAGTYVCNALGYQLVHRYAGSLPSTFVHLPFLPEQRPGDDGTMPLEAQRSAVLVLLRSVAAQLGGA